MKVIVDAYAKINLLLDIVEKLPNGYHSLRMIMQSVSLCDTVTVERGKGGIVCDRPDVPTDGKNIAWKAVVAFEKATGLDCSDTQITIEKRIPSAAGLAGGSADGAAVLAALQEGKIEPTRHASYVRLYESAKEIRLWEHKQQG